MEKGLESLVEFLTAPDKIVKLSYTALGKKIPEGKLYHLCLGANAVGIAGLVGMSSLGAFEWVHEFIRGNIISDYSGKEISTLEIVSIASGAPWTTDLKTNVLSIFGERTYSGDGHANSVDPTLYYLGKITKALRFPFFSAGVFTLASTAYDLISSVFGFGSITHDTGLYAGFGAFCLSLASSMYLKDQDPKSLDKLKNKIKNFFTSNSDATEPAAILSYNKILKYI